MDPVTAMLVVSASDVVQKFLSEYRRKAKAPFTIKVGEREFHADQLTPEMAAALADLLASSEKPAANTIALSRKAHQSITLGKLRTSETEDKLGAWALAISPDAVFADARKRMSMVFRLNMGVTVILAVILLAGIGGSVLSAVFLRNSVWSLAFGGISVADLLGVYIFKPLNAINAALVGTQRLEMLQLRLSQQLASCAQVEKLEDRIKCQTGVWEAIQADLAVLAGASAN